jgi:hypothetical protein
MNRIDLESRVALIGGGAGGIGVAVRERSLPGICPIKRTTGST